MSSPRTSEAWLPMPSGDMIIAVATPNVLAHVFVPAPTSSVVPVAMLKFIHWVSIGGFVGELS